MNNYFGFLRFFGLRDRRIVLYLGLFCLVSVVFIFLLLVVWSSLSGKPVELGFVTIGEGKKCDLVIRGIDRFESVVENYRKEMLNRKDRIDERLDQELLLLEKDSMRSLGRVGVLRSERKAFDEKYLKSFEDLSGDIDGLKSLVKSDC